CDQGGRLRVMGELAPGVVLEALTVLRGVLDVAVSDVADVGVHRGDLGDVRGVDDPVAAVGADGLGLVEALRAGPHVVVHLRYQGDDPLAGPPAAGDAGLRRDPRHRRAGRRRDAAGDGAAGPTAD